LSAFSLWFQFFAISKAERCAYVVYPMYLIIFFLPFTGALLLRFVFFAFLYFSDQMARCPAYGIPHRPSHGLWLLNCVNAVAFRPSLYESLQFLSSGNVRPLEISIFFFAMCSAAKAPGACSRCLLTLRRTVFSFSCLLPDFLFSLFFEISYSFFFFGGVPPDALLSNVPSRPTFASSPLMEGVGP